MSMDGPPVVNISTPRESKPSSQQVTPTSEDLAAAGRRISVPTIDDAVRVSSRESDSGNEDQDLTSSDQCELDCLREQLQQLTEEKAELIEESLLDKERIKDQRETIELLTKRIREFEMMGRSTARPRSGNTVQSNAQIKQLGEDNIQLAREVDRLIAERDRLEKKLIDLKIKLANGYLTRQNSSASTDEDEINVFSTLSVDERLRRKKGSRVLGPASASKSGGVFSAARSWFARKGPKSPSKANRNKPNAVASSGIAV